MFASANSALFTGLVAVVALAPLPLASARPWAWSLLSILVGMLLAAWAWTVATGRARVDVPLRRLRLPMALFLLALAWAAMQAFARFPTDMVHPLWDEAAKALHGAASGTISMAPDRTATALMRLACYGGVFFLAVQLGRERSRAHHAQIAVAAIVVLYAAYGLSVFFSGTETILWLDKWAYLGDLTATFVNRNAFGAYAGLGCVVGSALFVFALRPRRAGRETGGVHALAEKILVKAAPWLLTALVTGSALLLSHSRAAFLCTGAALVAVMAGMVACGAAKARNGAVTAIILLVVGVGIMGVSGEGTFDRLAGTNFGADADAARSMVYRLVTVAIADAPWTGYGLGSFEPAFAMYRDTSLAAPLIWDYAHNVHLELLMDLGLPATILFYAAIALPLGACLRGIATRRRDQIHPIVAVAATLLLGLHGLVDFSVQMPAVAVTFAFLLGIGYAQSWNTAPQRLGEMADGRGGTHQLAEPS